MAKLVDKFYKDTHANIFNFSYSVLAILLLLTIGISYIFYTSSKNKDIARFANASGQIQAAIASRIELYISLLNGTRGFIDTSDGISRGKFDEYLRSLEIDSNYAGLRSVGLIKTLKEEEVDYFVEQVRATEDAGFHVFPTGSKAEFQVLLYVFSQDPNNQSAVGLDMSSEAARSEAMRRAKDTGEAAASGKVLPMVVQDENTNTQARTVIFVPIYGDGAQANAARTVDGYIYGSFIAERFLEEIYNSAGNKDIAVRIYDQDAAPEHLLAEIKEPPESGFLNFPNEKYRSSSMIEVAGRQWVIEYRSLPSFITGSSLGWTPLIFICGVFISFILFGMTYWEASARVKLQRSASELFETQKEKEKLYEEEQKSRLAAERANVAKDEFIAIISHELKTPLNAIAGWARILKTHDISDDTRETALVKIDKNLRTQAGLVEQLLTYSDIISGSIDITDKQVSLSDLVKETITELEPLANEKNIRITSENSLDGEFIAGDADKLKIVLDCILKNALKFTDAGGEINTALSRTDESVRFSVKDNGRGITKEFMPFIFDQYKQGETPNIRDYGGLGLGLTISRHIVELHNGTIEAESDGMGKGSRFSVVLPYKAPA